jgi:hypothetical protein
MKKKKTIKKIKSATKSMAKKTKSFAKKTSNKVSNIADTLQKEWKKEQPQREKLEKAASKALEHSVKIGGDVFETIRKDIDKINKQKKGKNK